MLFVGQVKIFQLVAVDPPRFNLSLNTVAVKSEVAVLMDDDNFLLQNDL